MIELLKSEILCVPLTDGLIAINFSNKLNIKAHCETTGPEICSQYSMYLPKPSVFVAGTGTGGTLMGVSNYIKN